MNYLMVASVPCHRISPTVFATESAFAEHLRQLQAMWADRFDCLVIAAPLMPPGDFEQRRNYLGTLDAGTDRIRLAPMHVLPTGGARYWFSELLPNVRRLHREVSQAGIVHAGPSHFYRPFECIALLIAALSGKPSIYVSDVDERRSSWMRYRCGRSSLKSYLLARLIYDPFASLQNRVAVRVCSLVLLKGQKLCDDYGAGRPNVKNFVDAAFSAKHVIPAGALEEKIARLREPGRPLEVVYFGRLVGYKGIDRSIAAIARVIGKLGPVLRLHVIGTGDQEPALRAQAEQLGIAAHVQFHGAIPFGQPLFDRLYQCDLLLATPLNEDTPRNAFDAMASGIPILAFDTYYYQDLLRSGAVAVVPWPAVEALADQLAQYAADKPSLENAIRSGVHFALANTQEIWLQKRYRWTQEAMARSHPP